MQNCIPFVEVVHVVDGNFRIWQEEMCLRRLQENGGNEELSGFYAFIPIQ